ncbi:MAG: TetR/AcrR family transcriptional regulator [Bacillota bacterium]
MTKHIILQKALELFMERGYDGASMSDIAIATGIRKASLYAHFKGKESIFAAIFEDILAEYVRFIGEIAANRAGETAPEQLERMFLAFILYCHGNAKMYFWDRHFYFPPAFIAVYMRQKTQETQDAFLYAVTRCIERGIRGGELRPQPAADAALAFYYLMIGLSMSVKLYDKETLERDARAAWHGLQTGLLRKE